MADFLRDDERFLRGLAECDIHDPLYAGTVMVLQRLAEARRVLASVESAYCGDCDSYFCPACFKPCPSGVQQHAHDCDLAAALEGVERD